MSEFVKVAQVKDVPAGTGISIEAGGKAIALFNCDGTFLAMDDTCPHQGGAGLVGFLAVFFNIMLQVAVLVPDLVE